MIIPSILDAALIEPDLMGEGCDEVLKMLSGESYFSAPVTEFFVKIEFYTLLFDGRRSAAETLHSLHGFLGGTTMSEPNDSGRTRLVVQFDPFRGL